MDELSGDLNYKVWSCAVCAEPFADILILPCQHKFCERCLTIWVGVYVDSHRSGRQQEFPCRLCWQFFNVPLEGGLGAYRHSHAVHDLGLDLGKLSCMDMDEVGDNGGPVMTSQHQTLYGMTSQNTTPLNGLAMTSQDMTSQNMTSQNAIPLNGLGMVSSQYSHDVAQNSTTNPAGLFATQSQTAPQVFMQQNQSVPQQNENIPQQSIGHSHDFGTDNLKPEGLLQQSQSSPNFINYSLGADSALVATDMEETVDHSNHVPALAAAPGIALEGQMGDNMESSTCSTTDIGSGADITGVKGSAMPPLTYGDQSVYGRRLCYPSCHNYIYHLV